MAVTDKPSDRLPAAPTPEVEKQANQLFALVLAKFEQHVEHLHMPVAVPSAAEAAALKSQAPEVYNLWLKLAEKKADDDAAVQRLPFDHAFRLARVGQFLGFGGLLGILGFCAYLASLGGGVQYLAGVIGALDIVSIIGAFRLVDKKGRGESD